MMNRPAPMPLKMQTHSILKEAIINGSLKDNEMVTEKRAFEQFGISRTPFREAVQMLEMEGWVYTIPYKGTYVSPVTIRDIEEVFELRMILEGAVVRKIAKRMEEATIHRLESIVSQMKLNADEQSQNEFLALDRDFHDVLYDASDNRRLCALIEQNSDLIRRIGMKILHRESRRSEVIEEHRSIIDSLKTGQAEEAVIHHLDRAKRTFLELYEGGEP